MTREKQKVSVSWSGGKDATLALYVLLGSDKYEIASLHTTIDQETQRVGMHGIPEKLVAAQARAIGIPWEKIELPADKSNRSYEEVMQDFCQRQIKKGISTFVYGDIFLEDLKQYRERQLHQLGMEAIFPLWKKDTSDIIHVFINHGFKTLICCADDRFFDRDILGQVIDHNFIGNLPDQVDPCGENGEFHTFTYAGPLFKWPVQFEAGEKVLKHYEFGTSGGDRKRSGFWFLDLKGKEPIKKI